MGTLLSSEAFRISDAAAPRTHDLAERLDAICSARTEREQRVCLLSAG